MCKMLLLARPVDESKAALISQANIQQNDVRQGCRGNAYETLFQCRRKDCFVTLGFEPMLEEFAILRIVLHHKNPLLHSGSFCRGRTVVVESLAQTRHTLPVILPSELN